MKKLTLILTFLLCILMLFCSCGKNESEPVTQKEEFSVNTLSGEASENVSLTLLTEKCVTDISFGETLESQEDAGLSVYRMSEFASASFGYCGSATAEQIVLFAVNDGCMESAKETAVTHLKYLSENYASYAPDEVPKLEKAVVKNYGDILAVCVSSDSEAEAKLDSIFA